MKCGLSGNSGTAATQSIIDISDNGNTLKTCNIPWNDKCNIY